MSNTSALVGQSNSDISKQSLWAPSAELSAYLDFLRFSAAFAVLLFHMDQDGFRTASLLPMAYLGHEAVIIFFVMSGFIIYSSTMSRNHSWQQYILARSARIYSVAIPAVFFSLWISSLAPQLIKDPQIIQKLYQPFDGWTLTSSLLFLNQSWGNTADLSVNGPYWSLCYEVWYYIFFGIFIFCPKAIRWWILLAAALCAGPAILALLPIWLMGAWLASRMPALKTPPTVAAWVIFIGTFLVTLLIRYFDIDVAIRQFLHQSVPGFWHLNASQRVVTDHLIAIAVLLNIYAFGGLNKSFKAAFSRYKHQLGLLAGFSFTLYLFHRPVTQVAGRMFPNVEASITHSATWVIGVLFCCYLISWLTERQTYRWRLIFAALLPSSQTSPARNSP